VMPSIVGHQNADFFRFFHGRPKNSPAGVDCFPDPQRLGFQSAAWFPYWARW